MTFPVVIGQLANDLPIVIGQYANDLKSWTVYVQMTFLIVTDDLQRPEGIGRVDL